MKRIALIIAVLSCCVGLHAQNYNMNLHRSGSTIYTEDVNNISRIHFEGSQPANMLINNGTVSFPITAFDSITFLLQAPTQYTITVNANNNAWGCVSGGGVYDEGTICTLEATPASGYLFESWKKNNVVVSTNATYSFTVTENATYTAYFTETPVTYYTITTNVSPSGAGTVTGGGSYPEGSTAILTASANEGYAFDHWQDNNTDNPRTITVTQNATYTAIFEQDEPPAGDTVFIVYNGSSVNVTNPFSSNGVEVTASSANVTVNSTMADVPYVVSGSSANGSLTMYSTSSFYLALNSLNLTSTSTAAINLASNVGVTLALRGTSTIADGANGSQNGALYAAGNLTVSGNTLNVTGNAKHGISVEGAMTVNSGTINILDTDSDGIHGSGNLVWNNGTLDIASAGSDGLDFSGTVTISNGSLTINTTTEGQRSIKVTQAFNMTGGTLDININGNDCKGIKGDSAININGGTVDVQITGTGSHGISSDTDVVIGGTADITVVSSSQDGKCIKSDGTVHVNGGTLELTHSGDISKGITATGDITITGGDITITASGSTVLETVSSQNVPAYCTAIKSDSNISISDGTFHITLPTTNHGGKSISADGNLTISGGDFTITTQGNGASYTVSGNTKDSYTSSCLKSDGNMQILAGNFTLSSSGTGGKGINVGGTLVIGQQGANNDELNLNVTTSGERITVSSGGGGWPGGGGGDYANPKGIKAQGNLTINSGNITVNCTQSQNEGGECIESKATLTINGGNIEAYSVKDDAVNAAQNLTINGGVYYVHSDNNDGTDSNGTMFINGGLNISNGARQPEEGFDCDNNQFKITGSTSIGTGGGTSNPTTNVCTQPSLKINTQQGYAIQILKSDGTVICTYQCPTFTGGGGGGGGGGSSMVMLFTDPQLQTGQSYTVKYNGTISGGTNWNGYYTGNVTYSGGQSTSVTINSMFTTVSAGGGGGW